MQGRCVFLSARHFGQRACIACVGMYVLLGSSRLHFVTACGFIQQQVACVAFIACVRLSARGSWVCVAARALERVASKPPPPPALRHLLSSFSFCFCARFAIAPNCYRSWHFRLCTWFVTQIKFRCCVEGQALQDVEQSNCVLIGSLPAPRVATAAARMAASKQPAPQHPSPSTYCPISNFEAVAPRPFECGFGGDGTCGAAARPPLRNRVFSLLKLLATLHSFQFVCLIRIFGSALLQSRTGALAPASSQPSPPPVCSVDTPSNTSQSRLRAVAAVSTMQDLVPTILIPASTVVGVLFAIILWKRVSQIQMTGGSVFRSENGRAYLL